MILTVKSAEISDTSLESFTVYCPQSIVSACLIVMVACVRVVVTTNWIRFQGKLLWKDQQTRVVAESCSE